MRQDSIEPAHFQENGDTQVTHSEDGVDLTLIRWMLSLTPEERLEALQRNLRSIMRLRGEESDT